MCERERVRERYSARLSSGCLCNVHNTGVQGGSKTWGAYITKSDTVVQLETMSREGKTLKYKNRHSLGMEERRKSTLGTGYTSSLRNNEKKTQKLRSK